MFREVPIARALRLVCGVAAAGASIGAIAQDVQRGERVEVTGSAIRQLDAETSVPLTVLKVDDLKKEGVTTIEQVLTRIAASQTQQTTSQSVGSTTGGASFANLRGLGQNKTLVLLNGRRIANNAIDSSAPDLNTIPFAALERVEVLRDGASALYGTDAIGGVINFITRKDFQGGTATVGADSPRHPGGHSDNANIGYGFGDLAADRFNVLGFFDYEKQDPLRESQRDVATRIVRTSPTTFPGQYNQGGNVQNPAAPACFPPDGVFLGNPAPNGDRSCGYIFPNKVDLIPNTERFSGLLRGTLQVTPDSELSLEYFGSQNKNNTVVAGNPYGAAFINPGTTYYPGNGITPLPTAFTLNPAYFPATAPAGGLPGLVRLRWRDTTSGGRQEMTTNTQHRVVLQYSGTAYSWDYQVAGSYNENKIADRLTNGYTDGTLVMAGLLNGTINPFGDQSAAGTALLNQAAARGELFKAKGTVTSVDAKASREIGDWFGSGRQSAVAFGSEFRYEKFSDVANSDFAALVVNSTGFDPGTNNVGNRHVSAAYAELNVPVLKSLDFTAAIRYDKYSDFGNTTNPKGGFRFQPIQQVLFRGSYSTGFRAPSLFDLNAPSVYTNTGNAYNDPVRCPGGNPLPGVSRGDNCQVQFQALIGGNKALQAETSKNYSLGTVIEPVKNLTVSIDLWQVLLKKQISGLSQDTIFADPVKYAALFHRAPDGSLSTDGSLCPGPNCGYIEDTNANLGRIKTNGLDLGVGYTFPVEYVGTFAVGANATYVHRYLYQNEEGGEYFQNVGVYSGNNPIFKWQAAVNVDWTRGPFGLGVASRYKTGYLDQDPSNHVSSYILFDAYGSYQPIKNITLTVGMKNIADRQPPFSNQTLTFQVGYDPRYSDPLGRTLYGRASITF